MRLPFLLFLMGLMLCSDKDSAPGAQSASSLGVSISLSSDRQFVNLKLCNLSSEKVYLYNFYELSTHFRIVKRDTSSGKYFDYQSIFNSLAMQTALDSTPRTNAFPFLQNSKNYFADAMAKELSEMVKNEGTYVPNLIGEPYDEFYSNLMNVLYLNGTECKNDVVNLRPIKNEKGNYKIFFEYQIFPIPLQESLGSYMYRFYYDRMPDQLKGYKRWQGRVVSDTLELEIN
jgi:hypothetical protein